MRILKIFIIFFALVIMFYLLPETSFKSSRVISLAIPQKNSANIKIDNSKYQFKPPLKSFDTKQKQSNKYPQDLDSEYAKLEMTSFHFNPSEETIIDNSQQTIIQPDYWQTLYSVESKQGLLLFRPRNKSRNCDTTHGPCGHHQLTAQALNDIGCKSRQCRKDRIDYSKSLTMSKRLQQLNGKRMLKKGYQDLPEYQKYLIHQQGATGISIILAASRGKKLLSRNIKTNMANNSPYSYKQLKRMGSQLAANKFMEHWQTKWAKEKLLIIKTQNNDTLPQFTESELQLALNIKI